MSAPPVGTGFDVSALAIKRVGELDMTSSANARRVCLVRQCRCLGCHVERRHGVV